MNTNSPIKSGWRGNINGYVEGTGSHIQVSEVTLKLNFKTAWALANILTDTQLEASNNLETEQKAFLSNLGASLGRMIDHDAANNGDRKIVKG